MKELAGSGCIYVRLLRNIEPNYESGSSNERSSDSDDLPSYSPLFNSPCSSPQHISSRKTSGSTQHVSCDHSSVSTACLSSNSNSELSSGTDYTASVQSSRQPSTLARRSSGTDASATTARQSTRSRLSYGTDSSIAHRTPSTSSATSGPDGASSSIAPTTGSLFSATSGPDGASTSTAPTAGSSTSDLDGASTSTAIFVDDDAATQAPVIDLRKDIAKLSEMFHLFTEMMMMMIGWRQHFIFISRLNSTRMLVFAFLFVVSRQLIQEE